MGLPLELQSLMLQHLIIFLIIVVVIDLHHIVRVVLLVGLGRIWRPGPSPESERDEN